MQFVDAVVSTLSKGGVAMDDFIVLIRIERRDLVNFFDKCSVLVILSKSHLRSDSFVTDGYIQNNCAGKIYHLDIKKVNPINLTVIGSLH